MAGWEVASLAATGNPKEIAVFHGGGIEGK
jgi:hypothetical protein